MKDQIKGVVCPCITPFDHEGNIDEKKLRDYLAYLANNVEWISIGAIYGSGILMSSKARKSLFDIAADEIGGKAKISVFVGATNTELSVDLAAYADKIHIDAITCVAPFYYRQVDQALFGHYKAILDTTRKPVYVYDSPIYAGNHVSYPVLEKLAEAGLAGVITGAAQDGIEHLYAIMRRVNVAGFDVLSIRDGLALPAMVMGAVGFESGIANFFPELARELHDSIVTGNLERAAVLQQRALRLRDISHGYGKNVPTLHALLELRGLESGHPKAPFFHLSQEEVSDLKEKLSELDFEVPLNL